MSYKTWKQAAPWAPEALHQEQIPDDWENSPRKTASFSVTISGKQASAAVLVCQDKKEGGAAAALLLHRDAIHVFCC